MISTSNRTLWVDQMRGICMMAILLFHTEAYYNDGREIIPYNFYVANVLVDFFFLSGYLFHSDITAGEQIKQTALTAVIISHRFIQR